jgi:hypothetical protein
VTADEGAPAIVARNSNLVTRRSTEVVRGRPVDEDDSSNWFDGMRTAVTSDWLRRVFILFLVAALVGLAASTYYYFAGEKMPFVSGMVQGQDGLIIGATNVNLRSDPHRQAEVLSVLPEGSRVRAFENREGWRRVRVLEWAGPAPDNAAETGWIDGRFIRFD